MSLVVLSFLDPKWALKLSPVKITVPEKESKMKVFRGICFLRIYLVLVDVSSLGRLLTALTSSHPFLLTPCIRQLIMVNSFCLYISVIKTFICYLF